MAGARLHMHCRRHVRVLLLLLPTLRTPRPCANALLKALMAVLGAAAAGRGSGCGGVVDRPASICLSAASTSGCSLGLANTWQKRSLSAAWIILDPLL